MRVPDANLLLYAYDLESRFLNRLGIGGPRAAMELRPLD